MPNTYSKIYLHFVFSPKYRAALIKSSFEKSLFKYITGIVKNIDQTLIQINGMPDHIHILVRLKPWMSPSEFMSKIKSNSSKWINENGFLDKKFNWQSGGGIFSVDYRDLTKIVNYTN